MHAAHLLRMDLNLLMALDALLDEGSVSGAARRVGLSQPAMSRALGRLRDQLNDAILVRNGRGMIRTPRAMAIARPLRDALDALGQMVAGPSKFEPASARRTFRLGTADYGAAVVVPRLLDSVAQLAPGVSIEVQPVPDDLATALETGRLDAAVVPRRAVAAGLVWRPLFSERFVCIVRRGHPELDGRALTLKTFCRLGHVVVTPTGRPGSPVDDLLARKKLERKVVLRVPNFLLAPCIVASTDLIATTPARLASQFAGLPIVAHEPPLPVPGFRIALGWHERFRSDPGHAWFRGVMTDVISATSPHETLKVSRSSR